MHPDTADKRFIFVCFGLEFHRLAPDASEMKAGNLWQQQREADAPQDNFVLGEQEGQFFILTGATMTGRMKTRPG
jgi:hypothetical protein